MELILYKTTDPHNVIGKKLTDPKEYNINLKRSESIQSPHIIVTVNGELQGYNYAYIEFFKRYYFIEKKERGNRQLVDLYLNVDVLESFKNDILASDSVITKASKPTFLDQGLNTSTKDEVFKYESDTTMPKTSTMVLTTIGG